MTGKVGEKLICDTSLVGHLFRRQVAPQRYDRWDAAVLDRIEAASLSVSVVTIAEARSGFLGAGWGGPRLISAERHLGRFRWIPIGRSYLGEWARLRVAAKRGGIAIGDNDLWVAATASVHRRVLVTCHRDHQRIAAQMPVEVVFLEAPV